MRKRLSPTLSHIDRMVKSDEAAGSDNVLVGGADIKLTNDADTEFVPEVESTEDYEATCHHVVGEKQCGNQNFEASAPIEAIRAPFDDVSSTRVASRGGPEHSSRPRRSRRRGRTR